MLVLRFLLLLALVAGAGLDHTEDLTHALRQRVAVTDL